MLRPQPIGIFPMPANLLLLPENARRTDFLNDLMKGVGSGECPPELSFYKLAADGENEKALANLTNDESREAKFNDFILNSSPEKYQRLKRELTGDYARLLDVAAYVLHYISEPPPAGDADGEILAMVLLTNASYHIEQGEIETAVGLLRKALEAAKPASPMFYGQILISLAETKQQFFGASADVIQTYKDALEVLKNSELDSAKASISMNLGICYQEVSGGHRGALLEAVRCYQEALKFYTRESFPEQFAFLQNNLALAYLSIPLTEASDQLRVAIAIQALREALKVYKKETHGELWASTQLNLANALQYAPTSHVEENLQEAVNLYEEILSVRRAGQNPAGYARLLANQANALAHLGIFEHAVPKFSEARDIFTQIGETESAEAVNEQLSLINAQLEASGQKLNAHTA
jgi:hypothetical protein